MESWPYAEVSNLDYLKAFSDREIQQVGQGQNAFYRCENRLDANWPRVSGSKYRTAIILGVVEYPKIVLTLRRTLIHVLT
jgi:hypothetical protein